MLFSRRHLLTSRRPRRDVLAYCRLLLQSKRNVDSGPHPSISFRHRLPASATRQVIRLDRGTCVAFRPQARAGACCYSPRGIILIEPSTRRVDTPQIAVPRLKGQLMLDLLIISVFTTLAAGLPDVALAATLLLDTQAPRQGLP